MLVGLSPLNMASSEARLTPPLPLAMPDARLVALSITLASPFVPVVPVPVNADPS